MKTASLTRFGSVPGCGTFGQLEFGNEALYTVEQEWKNNEKYVSCVPEGIYTMVPHAGKGPWAIVSEPLGVTHWEEPTSRRFSCLIHSANRASELQGCIAPGRFLGVVGDQWAVTHSAQAIRRMIEYFNLEEPWELEIRWKKIAYNRLS